MHAQTAPALQLPLSVLLAFSVRFHCVAAALPTPREALPAPSALPSQAALPDPLMFLDGSKVSTKEAWLEKRRPELKLLFQHYMYGHLPPSPDHIDARLVATHKDFAGGKGTMKVLEIHTGTGGSPVIDLLLLVPTNQKGPVPVFLAMNFCGNHAVVPDSRVPIPRSWVYSTCKGVMEGHASDAGRGSQAADWAVEKTLERGYALATFCSGDIDSDRKEVSEGIYAWLLKQKDPSAKPDPANRGSIAAWAWGFHRAVDYLVTDPEIDSKRIAAVGHSRNGKTALLAAAFDERIALAIPHQAGCGGTSPDRGTVGESVERINTAFPHWFCGNFKEFNKSPEKLPFDQNALVALCAPRPVLFSNAEEDQWANPSGQFEVLKAADPVYRFLGASGLEAKEMPRRGELSSGTLGYFIRPGQHSMTAEDWQIFLAFADRHFKVKAN